MIKDYVFANKSKTYYMRLPIDEQILYIDANKRTISVPNGINLGLSGDTEAETLWFCIDRYYDIQDLAGSDVEIRISWKHSSDEYQGYYHPSYQDIQSETGKIFFEWSIPALITEKSGTINFAIEFSIKKDGNIQYQLNTKPSSIEIIANKFLYNDNLEYQIDTVPIATIAERLQNTTRQAIIFRAQKPIEEYTIELIADKNYIAEGAAAVFTVDYTGPAENPIFQLYRNNELLEETTETSFIAMRPGVYWVQIVLSEDKVITSNKIELLCSANPITFLESNILVAKVGETIVWNIQSTGLVPVEEQTYKFQWEYTDALTANWQPINLPFTKYTPEMTIQFLKAGYYRLKAESFYNQSTITTYSPILKIWTLQ